MNFSRWLTAEDELLWCLEAKLHESKVANGSKPKVQPNMNNTKQTDTVRGETRLFFIMSYPLSLLHQPSLRFGHEAHALISPVY